MMGRLPSRVSWCYSLVSLYWNEQQCQGTILAIPSNWALLAASMPVATAPNLHRIFCKSGQLLCKSVLEGYLAILIDCKN